MQTNILKNLALSAVVLVSVASCTDKKVQKEVAKEDVATTKTTLSNKPIVLQRADPFIYKHTDGYYYYRFGTNL